MNSYRVIFISQTNALKKDYFKRFWFKKSSAIEYIFKCILLGFFDITDMSKSFNHSANTF